jgi:hypothetical protein
MVPKISGYQRDCDRDPLRAVLLGVLAARPNRANDRLRSGALSIFGEVDHEALWIDSR